MQLFETLNSGGIRRGNMRLVQVVANALKSEAEFTFQHKFIEKREISRGVIPVCEYRPKLCYPGPE
jgi:hypothetical protein